MVFCYSSWNGLRQPVCEEISIQVGKGTPWISSPWSAWEGLSATSPFWLFLWEQLHPHAKLIVGGLDAVARDSLFSAKFLSQSFFLFFPIPSHCLLPHPPPKHSHIPPPPTAPLTLFLDLNQLVAWQWESNVEWWLPCFYYPFPLLGKCQLC